METPILKQIAQLLQDRREHRRRLAVFVCLAVIVGFGTVAALRLIGQTLTHKERVLVCSLNLHEHISECYNEEGKLICGYADYVVHEHNDDCYNAEGERVCTLPEIEVHEHTDECYEEQKTLVCGLEESAGHEHLPECYTRQQGELTCQLPEHQHAEGCYDAAGAAVCGTEEHQHTDECYAWNEELACQDVGHTHTDECYKTEKVKICEKPEVRLHVHTDECYEIVEEEASGEETAANEEGEGEDTEGPAVRRQLICGQLQVESHVHAEEFNCFKMIEVSNQESEAETEDSAESEEGGTDNGIFTTDLNEEEENVQTGENEDTDKNEDPDETEEADEAEGTDGAEQLEGEENSAESAEDQGDEGEQTGHVKSYTGDGYKVTAVYDDRAEIPEEAELIAEQITAESDKEHYEEREAEYRESMGDENATMKGLFKIGFYIDGKEIEPKSAVKLTIQFLNENGLPEGAPITVVHFADGGTEVLNGSEAEKGSTTFNIGSFSEIAIGYGADVKTSVHISESYEYSDEAFHVTFHVEGTADLLNEKKGRRKAAKKPANTAAAEGETLTLPAVGESKDTNQKEVTQSMQGDAGIIDEPVQSVQEEVSSIDQTDQSQTIQPAQSDADPAEGQPADQVQTDQPVQNNSAAMVEAIEAGTANVPEEGADREKLEFRLQRLSKDSEAYKAVVADAAKTDDGSELLFVQTLSYSMYYDGVELDISRCKITAEVEAAKPLSEKIEESVPEAISYLRAEGEVSEESGEAPEDELQTEVSIEVVSIADGAEVKKIDNRVLSESNPNEAMQFAAPQMFATRVTGQPNPKFTVQYYANLDVLATSGENGLPVIDTSGGKLPVNGRGENASPNDNEIKNLFVDDTGRVLTQKTLTEVYVSRPYEYIKAPTINYINALLGKPNYVLKKIWIPKHVHDEKKCYGETGELICGEKATDPNSTNREDWEIHDYLTCKNTSNEHVHSSECYLHLTNRKVTASENNEYILISNNATIRLEYDVTEANPDFAASFYDYDITDGKIYASKEDADKKTNAHLTSKQGDGTWYTNTGKKGINSDENYSGKKEDAKLAFGNSNTGSGLQHELWDGNMLNKLNAIKNGHPTIPSGGSYKGCTFGLATGMSEDGKIQYASGVNAPNLFNEGSATGKTAYDDKYSLKFIRSGDTYTLSAVNDTGTKNLESFNHPSPYEGKVHTGIWTNNFWPMDSAASYGSDGHDMKIGNYSKGKSRSFTGIEGSGKIGAVASGNFPTNDDGEDHNSYFGMRYTVGFELSEDYIGPLEYYFFGDDDMWVFLSKVEVDEETNATKYTESQLVCDIGGTHSSVGEYINLWDYMKQDHEHTEECHGENGDLLCDKEQENKAGKWALTFYYTERGASGSTCWMQFTLPSASSLTPETTKEDYGDLRIEKMVTQVNGETETIVDNHDEFSFTVHFTDANGKNLPDDYAYVKYDKDGNEIGSDLIIWDGGEFTLKSGEYIIVKYLPQGARYEVIESNGAITITDNTQEKSTVEYFTDINISKKTDAGTEEVGNLENRETDKKAEGNIPSSGENIVKYNNKFYVYELPKTGGSGSTIYTIAGVLCVMFGAGFMYRKKVRERRVQVSSGN